MLPSGKPLALLTYLRSIPGMSAHRDHLVELFWGNVHPLKGRQSLRQTLSRLRDKLGPSAFHASHGDVVLVEPPWHDRAEFLEAIAEGDADRAVAAYGGPFFARFSDPGTLQFEHWADTERSHLSLLFLRAAEGLVVQLIQGEPRRALELSRRIRAEDDREASWRLVLRSALAIPDLVQAGMEAAVLEHQFAEQGKEPEPATAFLLRQIRAEPYHPAFEAQQQLASDLVGREQEFSQLMEEWRRAEEGAARTAHVVAPAGLGKTRLLRDAGLRLRAMGAQVIEVRANPGERTVPWCLVADLLLKLSDSPGFTGIETGSAQVLLAVAPVLGQRFPGLQPSAEPSPHSRGVALADALAAVADERPTAILLDDLHWADPGSREMLTLAMNRVKDARLFLVTAARPGAAGSPLPGEVVMVPLPPWSVSDCETFVHGLARGDLSWEKRLAEVLHRVSRGSPLLAVEAVSHALEAGVLEISGGYFTAPDFEITIARIAEGDPLAARLEALSPEDRGTLLELAVAGIPLGPDVLGTEAAGRLGVLELKGHASFTPDGWMVGHDEIAAALLGGSPDEEQREAGRRVGRKLLERYPADLDRLRRAIQLLDAGGDTFSLALALQRAIPLARTRGDRRPARQITGALMNRTDQDPAVDRAVARLPISIRSNIHPARAATAAFLVLMAAGIGGALLNAGAIPPEAELLAADQWTESPLTFPVYPLRSGEWRRDQPLEPSGTLTLDMGPRPCDEPVFDPAGGRAVVAHCSSDSGVTDLVLLAPGQAPRRLTAARGDDIQPSWAPDGSALAFATARWSGGHRLDLAVYDLESGRVRRLTSGLTADDSPAWSPDGTRIAFRRLDGESGEASACWVTVDGGVLRCHGYPGLVEVLGWVDGNAILGLDGAATSNSTVSRFDFRTGISAPVVRDIQEATISADGRWLAFRDSRGLAVAPLDRPRDHRVVGSSHGAFTLRTSHRRPFLARTVLGPVLGPLAPGEDYHVSARTILSSGEAIHIPAGVLRWSVSDSTMGTVDSITGRLIPRRPGSVNLRVNAGGWRTDSIPLDIASQRRGPVDSISWTLKEWQRWTATGTPRPALDSLEGSRVLLINGDETYESGVTSGRRWPVEGGLSVEVRFRAPVVRPLWQRLAVELVSRPAVHSDGIPNTGPSCGFRVPLGEGTERFPLTSVASELASALEPGRHELRDGRWHALLMEILPDGSCRVSADGRELGRVPTGFAPTDSVALSLYGQSVDTRIMIGAITVRRGTRSSPGARP